MVKKENKKTDVKKIVILGMFSALCFLISYLSHLTPALFGTGYLRLDFKDAFIAICGFIFGPLEAVAVSIIASLLEMLTFSSTGIIGFAMNVISSCSFAVVAALFYKRSKEISGAIFALVCGIIAQVGMMLLWNYIITPLYVPGMTHADAAQILLPVILPFNAIKAFLNMALTILLYNPVIGALSKAKLLPKREKTSIRFECIFFSVLIIITCILILLINQGVI